MKFSTRRRKSDAPKKIPEPSDEEKQEFLSTLQGFAPRAAVLSSVFVQPESCLRKYPALPGLPPTIMSLSRVHYRELSKPELEKACEEVFESLAVTTEESTLLLQSTLLQSESLLWYEHRKGRITASKFGAVCHTSLQTPSRSLVSSILQRSSPPKTAAMCWGIENEAVARQAYIETMTENHMCFECETSGLYVNPVSPHLGASPDGIVCCQCCGQGLLEIKCPYSVRHTDPTTAVYMKPNENGGFSLDIKHNYYYQIQGQMAIFEFTYLLDETGDTH